MVLRVWLPLLGLALVACARPNGAQLAVAEQAMARNEATYSQNENDATVIRAMGADLVEQTRTLSNSLDAAIQALHSAVATYDAASAQYATAAKAYVDAEHEYREVAYALIAAAASDVFIGSGVSGGTSVCGPRVSTAQYRRQLKAQGVDLEGIDIDHVVAHAAGGPDRPWNYNPLPASINRSLQDGGLLWKLQNYPLVTLRALASFALYTVACPIT